VYDAQPGTTVPPMVLNPYSTLSIPAYWRAINFLSENLASFPRAVHKGGSKTEDLPTLTRLLSRRPNGYQNSFCFWRTLFAHAAHYGNGYARIERQPMSYRPAALHNLMPEDVWPFRYDRGDGEGPGQYYLHRPTQTVLPGADVLHLSALSYDGMSGLDPVSLHSSTFQRAGTMDRFQTRYLQRGTVVRGAIEIPMEASEEQVAQMVDKLRSYFSGPDAERDVIVLTGGAKLNNTTISPQESQLIQQGAHVVKQIAQVTGVPPQFLFEFAESKYNNSIEAMGEYVVRYTFRPWLEQCEDELTLKLLTYAEQEAGYAVRLNPDALLRGDTRTQVDTVAAAVKAGLRTRNEGRELLNLPPDPSPESDQLKTLGDTTPAPPPAVPIANSREDSEGSA
jgi:HK97 family phage portal protein